MKLYPYEYAVLRYVHDPVTQEALNIGVLVYSKDGKFLELMASLLFGRLSEAFAGFDGPAYRTIIQHLNAKTSLVTSQMFSGNWLVEPSERIVDILPSILLPNDSSFEFCSIGSGVTPDFKNTLESLYARFVTRYIKSDDDDATRDDSTIWKVFASALSERHVMQELHPKTIETPTFEYEFDFAWKNHRWHPLQPLSFDLKVPHSIHQKANRWIGNLSILRKNQELGTVYFLIGKAQSHSPAVQKAYSNAVTNMRDLENVEIYEEDRAEEFARRIAQSIEQHKHDG